MLASAALAAATFSSAHASETPIFVRNHSFESPDANIPGFPVNTELDEWTDTQPRPGFAGPLPWGFGTGNFPNPEIGEAGHYNIMYGDRAAYILVSEQLGFFQDLDPLTTSPGGIFTVGEAYQLTVGFAPSSTMPAGTILTMSLYYRDGGNNIVPVAWAEVPKIADTDSFYDYQVYVPYVKATDAWANKPIGILFQVTTVPLRTTGPQAGQPNETGGYDLDNVRLQTIPEPSTGLIGGLGLALLAIRRRARRS